MDELLSALLKDPEAALELAKVWVYPRFDSRVLGANPRLNLCSSPRR